jgi:hypothetical protein
LTLLLLQVAVRVAKVMTVAQVVEICQAVVVQVVY